MCLMLPSCCRFEVVRRVGTSEATMRLIMGIIQSCLYFTSFIMICCYHIFVTSLIPPTLDPVSAHADRL